MGRFVAVLISVVLLAGIYLRPGAASSANPPDADTLAQQVLDLTNAQRSAQGLAPLVFQGNLRSSAMWLAQDLADYNYFSHTDRLSRDFVTRLVAFSYTNWTALGENIAAGYLTPADVVNAWLNSPSHRENILNPSFREIGVGYGLSTTSTYRYYWVQDFGARSTASAPSNSVVSNYRLMVPRVVRN